MSATCRILKVPLAGSSVKSKLGNGMSKLGRDLAGLEVNKKLGKSDRIGWRGLSKRW